MFEKTHSKLGIASTLLAFVIWVYLAIIATIFLNTDYFSNIFERFFSNHHGGMVKGFEDLGTAIFLLVVIFIIIPFGGHLLGFILGMVAVLDRNKKFHFGICGIIFNVFPFILSVILYVIS